MKKSMLYPLDPSGFYRPETHGHCALNSSRRILEQRGFTFIEAITVVVIIAILAAVAIPTYYKYIENQRLSVVTNIAKAASVTLASNHRRNGLLTMAQESDEYLKTLISIPNASNYVISVGPSGSAYWVKVREFADASITSEGIPFR